MRFVNDPFCHFRFVLVVEKQVYNIFNFIIWKYKEFQIYNIYGNIWNRLQNLGIYYDINTVSIKVFSSS